MITCMDFKFKSKDGQSWDTTGLGRFLKMQYPGAKNLLEALQMEREARAQKQPVAHPETPQWVLEENQDSERF